LEVQFDVNPNDVAHVFNVVLFDADNTQRVFRFANLSVGADQTLTRNLYVMDPDTGWASENNAGTIAGLDISTITEWHIQGTFGAVGDANAVLDLTFDNLALRGIPEPPTMALVGLASVVPAVGYRRRRSANARRGA
jgi:hypothetical protein